jgi:hypothetical protein
MNTSRLLRDSLRSLRRHRLRSASIMIGSLVGVASLTFVLDIGQGIRRKMLTTVQQIFGDSSVVVVAGGMQLVDGPRPDAARLTIDDIAAAAAAVPAVVDWDPQQVQTSSVRRAGSTATARVLGQSERAERVWARTVSRGRFFDAADVQRRERVALSARRLCAICSAAPTRWVQRSWSTPCPSRSSAYSSASAPICTAWTGTTRSSCPSPRSCAGSPTSTRSASPNS